VFALDANGVPSLPTNPSLPLNPLAGSGGTFWQPGAGMCIDPAGDNLYLVGNNVGNGVIQPISITVSGSTLVLTPGGQVPSGSGAGSICAANGHLFTADSSTISVYTYSAAGVVGAAKSTAWPSGTFIGGPDCIVSGSAAGNVYVGFQVDQVMQAFAVKTGTVQAPNLNNQQFCGNFAGPTAVVLHPNGKYLYAACGDGSVQILTVSSGTLGTGTFTNDPVQASPGSNPVTLGIAINPAGTLLACANPDDSSSVVAFNVTSTGALTKISTSGTYKLAGALPNSVVFDPSGTVVYAANGGNATISALDVSSASGLKPIAGSPFALPKSDKGPGLIVVR
jgi:6-phosphogluconolactonase